MLSSGEQIPANQREVGDGLRNQAITLIEDWVPRPGVNECNGDVTSIETIAWQ